MYHLKDTRTAAGGTGLLYRSYPHDWQLFDTCGEGVEPSAPGALLLRSPQRPSREEVVGALNAALAAEKERRRRQPGRAGGKRGWWGGL